MSNRLVKTPDTGHIVALTRNGFGDATLASDNEIKCAFFEQFSQENTENQELVQSDAYAYLDINNTFIKGLGYQLQGLYFKIAPFGVDQWYQITTVQVAQRKLLTNEVNNVLVNLQITVPPLGSDSEMSV